MHEGRMRLKPGTVDDIFASAQQSLHQTNVTCAKFQINKKEIIYSNIIYLQPGVALFTVFDCILKPWSSEGLLLFLQISIHTPDHFVQTFSACIEFGELNLSQQGSHESTWAST